MQPTRRRKKRPNYGVRSVELCRGKNGFGFTISGQQPCILSCIVPNSPADYAGLRPGDYLIAVCGQNVSKIPHDDVVQLIGSCYGVLKLQIAENYYSDSSEEDFISAARSKPKYLHKYKYNITQNSNTGGITTSCNTDEFSQYELDESCYTHPFSSANMAKMLNHKRFQNATLPPFQQPNNTNSATFDHNYIYQCIVGYLGTIEMPRKLTPTSRLQIVKGCIKRLRAEKRNHTSVMMTIFPCSLRLKNDNGITIAVYPGGRVTYCGAHSEQNKKYFGVVTTSLGEDPSNSCHIFVTLSPYHQEHATDSIKFKIECLPDDNTGICEGYPLTADPIVNGVRKYYENNRSSIDEPIHINSPQLSNDSTTTSNSDSGIGFRDDSGHHSDRILVVDIQNQRLHIQAAGHSDPQYIDCVDRTNRENLKTSDSTNPTQSFQDNNNFNDNDSKWSYSCDRENGFKESVDSKNSQLYVSSDNVMNNNSSSHHHDLRNFYDISQSLEDFGTQKRESPKHYPVRKHSLQEAFSSISSNQNERKSDNQYEKNAQKLSCESQTPLSKVINWELSLETLLRDSIGVYVFAEFLRKEFSEENIYFWIACEKYRLIENFDERRTFGSQIFQKYLANNATDPVNVDSVCQQLTQQLLHTADCSVFINAQKQIFNLMKFDCYPRFLKSDLYKDFLKRENNGELLSPSQFPLNPELQLSYVSSNEIVNKDHDHQEEEEEVDKQCRGSRQRRSLIPWSRSKCSKSRNRSSSDGGGSHSSLASWDLALPTMLCRVILPDASTAVLDIQTKTNQQTVRCLIGKLLEKRSFPQVSFQVALTSTNKIVDLEETAVILSGKEVKVEWRVEFILDLPDRKSLTIKSNPSHSLGAVIAPILIKHGHSLQMVTLCLMSENEVLEPTALVSTVDKMRVQVLTRSTPIPNLQGWNCHEFTKPNKPAMLDEITNRVFEELLHGKAENFLANPSMETAASVHSEEWGSEHSSGILNRFLRRDSLFPEKRRTKKCDTLATTEKKVANKLQPVIAKWKPTAKLDAHFEKDVLYEGLKRAQRGRLEDQRGTEINMELPDFLKTDKENVPCSRKKLRKLRKDFFTDTGKKDDEKVIINENRQVELTDARRLNDDNAQQENSEFLKACMKQQQQNHDRLKGNSSGLNNCSEPIENNEFYCYNPNPPPLPPKPTHWRSAYRDQPTSSFV